MGDVSKFDTFFDSNPQSLPPPDQGAMPNVPVAAPAPNKFDEFFDDYSKVVNQAAEGVTAINSGANPDHAARAQELSPQLGVPASVIESDLPTFEARAKAIKDNAVISGNPVLASWVAQNREGARMAQDDFEKLSVLGQDVTNLKLGFSGWLASHLATSKIGHAIELGASGALTQNALGRAYNVKQIANQLGIAAPDTDREITNLEAQPQELQLTGGYGMVQKFSGFGAGLLDNFLSSAPETVGGAGLGFATAGPPGAAVGAVAGSAVGFKADMARVSAGLEYRNLLQMKDKNGQPLDETSKQIGALFTGIATYAIAGIGVSSESKMTAEAISSLTRDAVTEAVTRPTFGKALAKFSGAVVKGGVTGAALNMGMEGAMLAGDELAKQASSGEFQTLMNDPATRQEAVMRLADAAESGAILFGALHTVGAGTGLVGDMLHARQASADAAMFGNLMDNASQSKLRSRSLEAFQSFLQHQADGSPIENVFLPSEKILKLYQSAKIDPFQTNRAQDPIFGWVHDMPQQLQEARERGGDVVIPLADYASHLAGSDIERGLRPDIKVRPDAMSLNEGRQFLEETRENLRQSAEETISSPQERVYQNVLQQAKEAGFGSSAAAQYAELYASRYTARAEQLGLNPWEAFQKSGVSILQGVSREAEKGVAGKDERKVLAAEKTFGQDAVPQQYGDMAKGAALTLTRNTAPGEGSWRVTHWLNGEPVRHVPYASYPEALAEFHQLALSEKKYNKYFEQQGEKQRGSITLTQGRAIINLFKDRDLSTFLHESGHLWLEELKADAVLPEVPESLKQDLQTVLKWFDVDSPEKITTEHHEQFARAFEQYAMEGKAPSTALASVFQRFKSWLTRIYQTVTNLGTPINPEIRGVFDRLLATDEEIKQAKSSLGILSSQAGQKFRDKLSGLMTKAEFTAYDKAINRANTEANETLLTKMMDKVRRERTADWKSERAKMVEEVTPEIDARPEIQALQFMPKLDRATIEKIYGGNAAMMYFLPKHLLAKEGGVHPDQAAEMLGFPSGDSMIKSLIGLQQEKKRLDFETGKNQSIRSHLIDQEVDKRMTEKYGDLLNSDSIRDETLAAVHNQAQEVALATELKVIGRKNSQPPVPLEVAREWALNTINNKRVKDVTSLTRYARGEASSAKAAELALLADKPEEAYMHKRQQILNHLLYSAAAKANADIERGQKLLERLAGDKVFKNIDQDYTDRIHELLQRFQYNVPRSQEELLRSIGNETLEGFVNRKYAETGYELAIDPMFYNTSLKGDVEQLTVGQFNALHDAVKSLYTVGRDEKTVMVNGERLELDHVKGLIIDELKSMKQRPKTAYYRPEDAGRIATIREKALGFFRTLDADLLTSDTMFDKADRDNAFGPLNTYVMRPLRDSMNKENDLRVKVSKEVRQLFTSFSKTWRRGLDDEIHPDEALTDPKTGQPFQFTRKRMLSIALNVGAPDNLTKLAAGYGWSEGDIMNYLDHNMTKEDWGFVSGMWKIVGQFGTDIDALNRRVKGVGIEFVKSRPIETKFGTIDGGYFPLVYDPLRSGRAEQHMEKATEALFERQYFRATTPQGSTISRVEGVKRPVWLDLDIVPWKLGQMIHDLTFRESIMDSYKILADQSIREAFDDSFGHEYTKTFIPWLQGIANGRNTNDQAIGFIEKMARWSRVSAQVVGLGWRATTMLKHGGQALWNSMAELDPRWMARGVKEFLGTPTQMKQSWDMVTEKSGMMRNRLDHYDRDMRDVFSQMLETSDIKQKANDIARYSYYGVAYLDMYSAMPTWVGAYRQAISEGVSESDAVYAADRTVIKAHGSGGIVDLPQIMRGNEVKKLLTMFYSFMNRIYNRQRETVSLIGGAASKIGQGDFAGARRDFPKILAKTMAYFIVLGTWESYVANKEKEEDTPEGYAAKAIVGASASTIPIARDVYKGYVEYGKGYEASPVIHMLDRWYSTAKDIKHAATGEAVSDKWLQHAIESGGYIFQMPTGQPAQTAQFLWDYHNGDANPEDVSDFFHGVVYGKTKAQ